MKAYEVVRSSERLSHIAQEVLEASVVALDLETTGFSPYTAKIRLLSLNTGKGVYVVDLFETGTIGPLEDALAETNAVVVGQSIKFDQKFLLHYYGLEFRKLFDTYRASAILYNGRHSGKGAHDLYALYARELEMAPEAPDLGGSDWTGPLTREQLDYAAEDVIHLPALRLKLIEKIKKFGLAKIALIEFQAILPEAAMELAGFGFDKEAWTRLAEENGRQAARLQKELLWELPHPGRQIALPGFDPDFNIASPKQLLESLRMLGIPVTSTAEASLAMLADDAPVLKKVLAWRGYAQSVKTFGLEYMNDLNPVTGRMHTNYYPFTGAGRYASNQKNLQQVPRDKRFRACFRPPPGRKLVIADLGQVELRISADVANDKAQLQIFKEGGDIYSQTAAIVMGADATRISKGERDKAKAIALGFLYGMGAEKFLSYAKANYGASFTQDEAEAFRNKYFDAFHGIRTWHRLATSDQNRSSGVTRTLGGRLRYLPPEAYTEYLNTTIQGTGADGLKTSIRLFYDSLRKYNGRAQMIHMVHDEIIAEADDDPELLEAVKQDLERDLIAGVQQFLTKVQATAEGGVCDTWADK